MASISARSASVFFLLDLGVYTAGLRLRFLPLPEPPDLVPPSSAAISAALPRNFPAPVPGPVSEGRGSEAEAVMGTDKSEVEGMALGPTDEGRALAPPRTPRARPRNGNLPDSLDPATGEIGAEALLLVGSSFEPTPVTLMTVFAFFDAEAGTALSGPATKALPVRAWRGDVAEEEATKTEEGVEDFFRWASTTAAVVAARAEEVEVDWSR